VAQPVPVGERLRLDSMLVGRGAVCLNSSPTPEPFTLWCSLRMLSNFEYTVR